MSVQLATESAANIYEDCCKARPYLTTIQKESRAQKHVGEQLDVFCYVHDIRLAAGKTFFVMEARFETEDNNPQIQLWFDLDHCTALEHVNKNQHVRVRGIIRTSIVNDLCLKECELIQGGQDAPVQ